jgi:hydrogenase maturation protease
MSSRDRPLALVVGVGNSDRGDDGVGPRVARRLRGRVPAGVSVLECGGDALALIQDWEGVASVILVDAMSPIGEPGRVHRLDLARNRLSVAFAPPSTHTFGLAETVELARSLTRLPKCLIAYLIEAEQFETGAPLSPAVATAIEEAAEQVLAELALLSQARRDHA